MSDLLPSSPVTPPPPVGWFRRRALEPLLNLLRQGLSPRQLALTVALATACGLVPLLGVTTLLATVAAVRLRLNVAAMLLVSHLLSPLQLLLMIPLLQWGERLISNSKTSGLTLEKLRYYFAEDWSGGLQVLWRAELGALLLWLGLSAVVGPLLFVVLRPMFAHLAARQKAKAIQNA
ncbi:DUF2062 domain-containing protein [Hymenobacter sp. DG25A]|uniref:DUF2062 domain-containing protein n=1 Tax=Hymenobacter sp. DG25A TaxID=1385663 RepID=UPI0006C86BEA|nr:DUF2062 domain-containing protein [Hymenobacter sp. DG25A]